MTFRAYIPASIDQVDGPWLSEALGVGSITVAGDPEPLSSFACQVYRLNLTGEVGTPGSVIVKLPIHGDLRQLIDGLGIYRREVVFYDRVAERCPLRVPSAYVARIAAHATDFVLVLEDLGSPKAADQLAGISLAQARAAIDELVRFHAWSWESPLLEDLAEVFPPLDSPAGRAAMEQWGQFFAVGWAHARTLAGDVLTPPVSEFAESFTDYVPFFISELARPRVLTHDELRADNMLFGDDGSVFFIDFQNVQQECGPRELAYFITQSLSIESRRGNDEALVRRYWQGLLTAGVTDYTFDQAWCQYRIGVANQLMLSVIACMRYDEVDERTQRLLTAMVTRGLAAVTDLDVLSLLPARDRHRLHGPQ